MAYANQNLHFRYMYEFIELIILRFNLHSYEFIYVVSYEYMFWNFGFTDF